MDDLMLIRYVCAFCNRELVPPRPAYGKLHRVVCKCGAEYNILEKVSSDEETCSMQVIHEPVEVEGK